MITSRRPTAGTLAAIHAQISVEEVVGDFVALKRKGQNMWACCPFHHEKTPSFSVAPSKGFYKCFGCDAKGDAISFLKAHEGMGYLEVMYSLARKHGVTL